MARTRRSSKVRLREADVLAEAVRIASEARNASVEIDWSVSAKTPLEGEIRLKLIHGIELEEFANWRTTHRPLSWVAMRIRQRLLEFKNTIDEDSETIGADLKVADYTWLAFHEQELVKETKARQERLHASAIDSSS
jgi:hypothetical protein